MTPRSRRCAADADDSACHAAAIAAEVVTANKVASKIGRPRAVARARGALADRRGRRRRTDPGNTARTGPRRNDDSVDAVLNGTSTFVLDRLREGVARDAVEGAGPRLRGVDPTRDLNGPTPRVAGARRRRRSVSRFRGPIPVSDPRRPLASPSGATRLRLVARARRVDEPSRPRPPRDDPRRPPSAALTGEECGAVIRLVGRRGRWSCEGRDATPPPKPCSAILEIGARRASYTCGDA
jgi:hypothetical protein